MLKHIIDAVNGEVSGERIMSDVRALFNIDRWFTYPKFLESAGYVVKRLKAVGADETRVVRFKADGRTLYGAWRTPMAWDVKSARLTVVEPQELAGEVLADYHAVPCSLVMWSGPTPKDGVTAEVVDVGAGDRDEDYRGKKVRGKIVLTNQRASTAKGKSAKRGAVGVLSDWNAAPEESPDAVFWNNTFNNAPAAWGPSAKCSRLFGFGVSPNVGRRLRAVLASGRKLVLHAVSDTRLYAGPMPIATGLLKGRPGTEEVLVLGHGFEQGAKDNASGGSIMIEAMRVVADLVRRKVLPRPRRTIRAMVTNECFGTLGYVERYPKRVRNTVAALCLDGTGIDVTRGRSCQGVYVNPHSNASYLDTFAEYLAGEAWGTHRFNPWQMLPYAVTDNIIAHPTIGIPTIWVGSFGSNVTWHCTKDTPDRLDARQMEAAAVYVASYLYFLADAGTEEALWLAEHGAAAGCLEVDRAFIAATAHADSLDRRGCGRALEELENRLAYLVLRHSKSLRGVMRLVPKKGVACAEHTVASLTGELDELAVCRVREAAVRLKCHREPKLAVRSPFGTKPHRRGEEVRPFSDFPGPITYDPIPLEERRGYADPRWNGPVNVALGWADGNRTLNETVALAENEKGTAMPELAEELLWLIDRGMVRDAAKG
jgi:hypothetical protein